MLAMSSAASARAWSADELAVEPGVPPAVTAGWNAEPGPGSAWDKYYFRTEMGEERTIWCRHKDCDTALQKEDFQSHVPLYYLAPAGTGRWQAILSAYTMHWEPYKKGGLSEVISRAGTPLAIRPWRPSKKGDAWDLDGAASVLAPASREIVPPQAALFVEAGGWPACLSLDPAAYEGSPWAIKKLHPAEIEIAEASAAPGTEDELRARLKLLASHPDAGALTTVHQMRTEATAAAEAELNAKAPAGRFNRLEARFLACRVQRYDRFNAFQTELARLDEPAGFIAKWRQFVRSEMSDYMQETGDYQSGLILAGRRTVAALDGRVPALAQGPQSRPHPQEMGEAAERISYILEQVK